MNALLRIVGWVLAVTLVVMPVVAVLNGWVGASHWPLTRLQATGEFHRVDGALLRQTLLPYAQRGFFAVDLEAAQDAVAKLPWVETAEVRKRWPDVLEVRVVEHKPYARWGGDRLLSEHGRLFPAKGIDAPKELPQFDGPDTRTRDVVELYNESSELFAKVGVGVREVALDPRGSWTLGRNNGATAIVGRSDSLAPLDRFVRLLPQLLTQNTQQLARADLRYTNGFALTWKAVEAKAGTGSGEQGMQRLGHVESVGDPVPRMDLAMRDGFRPRDSVVPRSAFPVPRFKHQGNT